VAEPVLPTRGLQIELCLIIFENDPSIQKEEIKKLWETLTNMQFLTMQKNIKKLIKLSEAYRSNLGPGLWNQNERTRDLRRGGEWAGSHEGAICSTIFATRTTMISGESREERNRSIWRGRAFRGSGKNLAEWLLPC